MAALGAGAGVVRDLVGRKPGGGEAVLGRLEKRGGGVVVGRYEIAAPRQGGKGSAGFDRQLIEREMVAGEAQRLVEFAPPGGDRRRPGRSGSGRC